MDARSIIYKLRMGDAPDADELRWFAAGLASGAVSDAQAGAFAMAVCLNGLGEAGRVALTEAMRDSGDTMAWNLPGPVVDKHSTGGIGDSTSLILAPILAEAGVYNPMISGRGLGHTGGTLDKLESIPGFEVNQPEDRFRQIVREVGCAIVSAGGNMAPADRRLYAVRDVTGTVESIDLITASILSKKLAAGLQALVLDVKVGSGAFMATPEDAWALARSLVTTANGAGCRTSALLTDMDQALCPVLGNASEVAAVMDALSNPVEDRLTHVTLQLCGEALALAGVAETAEAGMEASRDILRSGRAMERFCRMVAAQGGPSDFDEKWSDYLPTAKCVEEPLADRSGYITAVDGRRLGLALVEMGGGRKREGDKIDHAVTITHLQQIGARVEAGEAIALVAAATREAASWAAKEVIASITIGDTPPDPPDLIRGRIGPEGRG